MRQCLAPGEVIRPSLSKEQEQLVSTAHELLAAQGERRTYDHYRLLTRREQLLCFIGKLSRGTKIWGSSDEDERRKLVWQTTDATAVVRGLSNDEFEQLPAWGGRVLLDYHTLKHLEDDPREEWLTLRAEGLIRCEGASDMSSWGHKKLWAVNLLEPIENPDEIVRLQADLNDALTGSQR